MVDTFLFLTLARTGDQLQGIKKGILEIADVIAVNKADGDREARRGPRPRSWPARCASCTRAAAGWVPPVLTCSGLEGTGVDEVWERVLAHRDRWGATACREAGRAAAGLHLGAGPGRAGPAAAALAGGEGDP